MQTKSRIFYTFVLLIAIVLVFSILKSFWAVCYLEGLEDFPTVVSFSDLHQTENLRVAREALNDVSGIYCISHNDSGRMYIGSSVDLGNRLMDHLFYGRTNPHLINAVARYGLAAFTFSVLEFCANNALLVREQFYLDKLFSFSKDKRYNILPQATSVLGLKHTEETKARISKSMMNNTNMKGMEGEMNPMWGLRGADHPSFGLVPGNALLVYIYNASDNTLVQSFPSLAAAARFLAVHPSTVSRYVKSGKPLFNLYTITTKPIQ